MTHNMNVLFIMTDQHRADHMSCSGNAVVKTPNLDRLANEGIRFTDAFCANPMCMPNRASIFTGVYPNVHGCRSNGINLPNNVETFVEAMRKSGYITYNVGKMHLQFYIPPFKRKTKSAELISYWMHKETAQEAKQNFPKPYYGFEESEITLGHGDLCGGHYLDWLEELRPGATKWMRKRLTLEFFDKVYYETEIPVEQYPTTYCKERTINFLERHSKGEYGEKPFFLCCSIPDPHHPVCPPGRYKYMYKSKEIKLPSSFSDIENVYNHKFLGPLIKNPIFRGAMLRESKESEVKEFTRLTYGSISLFDHAIGEILASLETLGYAENTIVIYTSDHGDLMGDHGMIYKGPSPFIGLLNVPLIMRVPGITNHSSVSNSLASSIDFAKTILTLTKVPKRLHSPLIQGIDLTPTLKNPTAKVRDHCFIEEDEELGPLSIRLRHLITETHKITIYAGLEDVGDIYDRINDPDELNNLWGKDSDLKETLVTK
ncbi:MAG: sulfatase, partial [Candidatus Hermodarchaeota archaeon]